MKWILPEYHRAINDFTLDKTERELAEKNLKKALESYDEYRQKNIDIYSKSFLDICYQGGFHDYKIRKIDFDFESREKGGEKLNIVIHLEHHGNRYFLISKGVTDYSGTMDIGTHSPWLNDYLYGEYYKDEENKWHHNFLFGDLFEFNITSEKFIFKRNSCY